MINKIVISAPVRSNPKLSLIGSLVVGLLLVLSLVLTACSTDPNQSSSNNVGNNGSQPLPPLVAVTAVKTAGNAGNVASGKTKRVGPASIYPNSNITPGDTFPGVTAKEVCVSGYSSSVRNVSSDEKAAVYQSYGMQNIPGKDEVDHLISLELGGSNNIKNLWPEPYAPPPGAHEKDKVENALHAEVCNGTMTLQEAQRIISTDWYAYYLQIENGSTKK